jgi:hypothetical protein
MKKFTKIVETNENQVNNFFKKNNLFTSLKYLLESIDGGTIEQNFWYEIDVLEDNDGDPIIDRVQYLYDEEKYEELIKYIIKNTGSDYINDPFIHYVNVKMCLNKIDVNNAFRKMNGIK